MTYIAAAVRTRVVARARESCEYCLVHAIYAAFVHEVDHIMPQKHGGTNALDNLAYACAQCNRFKGSDFASVDSTTGEIVALFNPRLHTWADHFKLDGARIVPISSIGRVTERLLQLNQIDRILLRKELMADGRYPYQSGQ
jgi:hypothetical protein